MGKAIVVMGTRGLAPSYGPADGLKAAGTPPSLPDCDVNGKVQAVTALRSNLRFAVRLLLVGPLAVDDPILDRLFLEPPDVPQLPGRERPFPRHPVDR